MRHDFIRRVAFVDRGLENLHALSRKLRAAQAPNHLFALAGEHWPDHHFDPAHIAFDDIHARPSVPLSCRRTFLCTRAAVHLSIIERRERRDHRDAKRILSRHQISAQHAPGALRVANADFSREAVDRHRKLHAAIHNFFRHGFGNFYTSRTSQQSLRTVARVRPTFQENAALSILVNHVEAAFHANKEIYGLTILYRNFRDGFGALPRALHQLFPARRRMAHAAFHFHADHFNLFFRSEERTERSDCIAHGADLRLARTSHDNEDFVRWQIHFRGWRDCTRARNEKTRPIPVPEENTWRKTCRWK